MISMKKFLGLTAIAILSACSAAPDTTSAVLDSSRAETEALTNALLDFRCRDHEEIVRALDAVSPRFWADLTRTGHEEAVAAYCKLYVEADRSDEGRYSRGLLMQSALEFAAVNDAIYDGEDVLPILQPALGKALGWGSSDSHAVRAAADRIAEGGDGRNGVYTDIKAYQSARRAAIDEFMTGH